MNKIDCQNLDRWFTDNQDYLDKLYELMGVDPESVSEIIFNKVGRPEEPDDEDKFIYHLAGYLGMCSLEWEARAIRRINPITGLLEWSGRS